ncbi:hypothetical protein U1Q18_021621, partial [Sarracenia purpurea var. burkii]
MLTCITCSKQKTEGEEEKEGGAAARGTPSTKDAIKGLTAQVAINQRLGVVVAREFGLETAPARERMPGSSRKAGNPNKGKTKEAGIEALAGECQMVGGFITNLLEELGELERK